MSELPEKDISNYSTISCCDLCLNYLKKTFLLVNVWILGISFELPEKDILNVVVQCRYVVFYNKLSWFVSELPEKRYLKRGDLV
jgi:hypothetical protein